ncbi:MAG: hypothetical protein FWD27_06510 [Coriobacteriia bacterium]|nr:hypothetical protein [Coriobacteriia bacterium]
MKSVDSIVTARVPREIRDQGDAALKRIEATVTELVNSAFEYVIKTGELPTKQPEPVSETKIMRSFDSAEHKRQFLMQVKATSLPMSPQQASLSAREVKEMRLAERYAEGS